MKRSLDDLALFLAIADASGLGGAARRTGQSTATLSRRMTALERQLDRRLFERGKRGYTLTAAGRALQTEATPLREAAARIDRWADSSGPARVRITAGHWTSQFIARHIGRIWSPATAWMPEFVPSDARVDIARREADIGIRNRRPEQAWLAGRVTTQIAYAEYGASPKVTGYLSLSGGPGGTPTQRWLQANRADQIVTAAAHPRLMLDLAQSGMGRIVLPCFAGDAVPDLMRVGAPIADLAHDEWIVAHHEARNDPPIRAVLDALTTLLSDTRLRPAP